MRINGRFIIKSLIYALIYIFFAVLETNVLNNFRIFGAKPNLIISLAAAAAVFENENYAACLGMICGFATDCAFASPFLFSGIYYFFAAYIAGSASRLYFQKTLVTMMALSVPACAVREIFNMFFLLGTWKEFHIVTVFRDYVAPEYLYTIAFAPAVYFLVKFTAGRISYGNV